MYTLDHSGQLKIVAVSTPVVSLYTVFQKSDAKIEITITATNLIRSKYPLSSFNYYLSGANVANVNKIHCTVLSNSCLKNGTQK